jgi:hypothetical protein
MYLLVPPFHIFFLSYSICFFIFFVIYFFWGCGVAGGGRHHPAKLEFIKCHFLSLCNLFIYFGYFNSLTSLTDYPLCYFFWKHRIAAHLELMGFDASLVATEWFLCLFSKSLPSEV